MKQHSSPAALRCFGFTVAAGVSFLGLLNWYRGHTVLPPILWTTAAVLSIVVLILPSLLRPVYKGWMELTGVLFWINTRIILGLIFYFVFTPIGLVMRLFHDPLDRRFRDGRTTYWVGKEIKSVKSGTYKNQF